MYCLPNPAEYNEPDFDKSNMVPVLLGMDHLAGREHPESALTIDFNTGLALESNSNTPEVFQLDCNPKGHYIRDVVQYLTLGKTNHEGSPTIHVVEGAIQSAELQTLEFHPIEYYDMTVADAQHDADKLERSRQNLLALHARAHRHDANAAASQASMCPSDKLVTFNLTVSASSLPRDHGGGTTSTLSPGHLGSNQGLDPCKEPCAALGPRAHHEPGRCGSQDRCQPVALPGTSSADETSQQCSRRMGALRDLQSSTSLHPAEGQPKQCHQAGESSNGATDARRAALQDAWLHADGNHLPGDAEENRCGGDLAACHRQGGLPPSSGGLCHPKGEGQECSCSYKIDSNEASDELYGVPLGGGDNSTYISTKESSGRDGPTPHSGGEGPAQPNVAGSSPCSPEPRSSRRSSSGGPDSSLRARDDVKERLYKPQSLTHKMAARVMLMATTMMAMAVTTVTNFSLDDRDGLWEVACAPHSWLSDAAQRQGLNPRRINLEAGFDLHKRETWQRLHALRKRHGPRRIWFSFPCTHWCPWTSLNYSTAERKEILESYRRRDRKMLWEAYYFIKATIEDDPETRLYWEWPHPCYGWNQAPLLAIRDLLQEHGLDWHDCRIDGCRYDMRDKDGNLLRKKWMIKTTDDLFHSQYRAKVCTCNHNHGKIEGVETSRSAYYPWKLVQSIARFWANQTCSHQQIRRMNFHDVSEVDWCEEELCPDPSLQHDPGPDLFPAQASGPTTASSDPPSAQEAERWKVKLTHFHRAAGHCSSRNLARIVRDANLEPWKVRMAADFKCPTCEAIKPGGISSGNVPPAATHAQFGPWEALGLDVAEWTIPGKTVKQKFLLMIDMATRLRMVQPLMESYDITTMKIENAEMVIKAITMGWLATYPKPHLIVADNAKSFTSVKLAEFCRDSGIELSFPAEKEGWAHGLVEHAIKDVKTTASAIQIDNMTQDPVVTLVLAAAALNGTEYVSGFSSHQWAFGRDYTINEEERRLFAQLGDRATFASMVAARHRAEQVATTTRSQRILTRLANSKARQPLRQYQVADLVMVWRQVLPINVHQGPRGGFKKSSRPGWVGPGRVVFSEMLPHQDQDDPRRHIIWVLLQGKLLRCSVHSVRLTTPTEKLHRELNSKEDPTKWKSLQDLIPQREFTDITDEVPGEDQLESPHLPLTPDKSTVIVPISRARSKVTMADDAWRTVPRTATLGLGNQAPAVAPFGLGGSSSSSSRPGFMPEASGSSEGTGLGFMPDATAGDTALDLQPPAETVNDYGPAAREPPTVPHPDESDSKRMRGTKIYDLKWTEQLEQDAQLEASSGDLYSAFMDTEDFMMISFDLQLETHRQRKMLERNPILYLTKKMNGAEVQLVRLNEHDKKLFHRAKMKEIDSFLKNQAVRKALNDEELRQAYGDNRIIKARWVLTWKNISPDEKDEALQDQRENPKTTISKGATHKAKARIVLLGYQHPSLLDRQFRTASPVQSMLGRNLIYLLATHHQWPIHGLDLATAFLQTQPTEADQNIWTTGVHELRDALGIGEAGIMKVLRNIYGSTTAPRGLWLDLHKTLVSLEGVPALGERCLWAWYSKEFKDDTGQFPRLLGVMGGHVDDFHVAGNPHSEEWKVIYNKILAAYKWGMAKEQNYRHAGTDLKTIFNKDKTFKISIDQNSYVETLLDVDIRPERLYEDPSSKLDKREVAACRTALGSLQWLAIQTQPQICARCNLLLTEVVTGGTLETAKEIQQMIAEVRAEPFHLEFFKLPDAKRWCDVVFISMGDQAHNNRPQGDSTGGMITLAAGPGSINGHVTPMVIISWRSWKLKRKAIGSNDAEVQAILEAEDQNFRVRMLWSELHGAGLNRPERRPDLVAEAENQTCLVKGILCTDSKGGFDAVEINESPLLGLSNMRAALQAFQLRDNLKRVACELRWLASDYDLGDAFTKKRQDCRIGLLKLLRTWLWSIAYDPNFVAAKKNKKVGKTAVQAIDDALGHSSQPLLPQDGIEDAKDLAVAALSHELLHEDLRELAINAGARKVQRALAINAGSLHGQIGSADFSFLDCKVAQTHDLSSFCPGATTDHQLSPVRSSVRGARQWWLQEGPFLSLWLCR